MTMKSALRELAARRLRRADDSMVAELRVQMRAAFQRDEMDTGFALARRICKLRPSSRDPAESRLTLEAKLNAAIAEAEAEAKAGHELTASRQAP